MQEVEAAVTAKLPTWKVQHLGWWVDLVEPQAPRGPVVSGSELMELEDEAQAAKFREVRTKLAQDTAAMLCEGFMERCCRVLQLCDKAWSDPKLDAIYRSAAQAAKA
eukprot:s1708_g2.t1